MIKWNSFFHFWAIMCKTVRPMLSDRCPVCLSVTFVHCDQTVGRIEMKLGTQVGLGPGHIVLDGDPAPPPPKRHCPTRGAWHSYNCGKMVGWIKMPLGKEVSLGPGHTVLDGDQAPHSSPSPLSAHAYCGQLLSSCYHLLEVNKKY